MLTIHISRKLLRNKIFYLQLHFQENVIREEITKFQVTSYAANLKLQKKVQIHGKVDFIKLVLNENEVCKGDNGDKITEVTEKMC